MSTRNSKSQKPTIVKPAFPHNGGKTRLLRQILPRIPEHRRYVEPFAGGLAVLLAKSRASVEVINDIDQNLVNFYRYVRYHRTALLEELRLSLSSRAEFEALLVNPGYTDLQRACRWFLIKVMSFASHGEYFGRARNAFPGFDRERHIEAIERVGDRLARVVIECQDWEKVVEFYDGPETFFFFDPPYVEVSATAYAPFKPEAMERLRDRLRTLQGSWLLTCDDSPTCRRLFGDFACVDMTTKYSCFNTAASSIKTRPDAHELLVLSPQLAEAEARAA